MHNISMFEDSHYNRTNSSVNKLSITEEPKDLYVELGEHVNLVARAHSSHPTTISYQWYDQHGHAIYNKNASNLFISPVQHKDFGAYQLGIFDLYSKDYLFTRWVNLFRKYRNPKFCSEIHFSNPSLPRQITELIGGEYSTGDTIILCAEFENATGYNWYKDGHRICCCNGNTLVIHKADRYNNGLYELGAINHYSGVMVTCETSVNIQN